MPRPKKSENFRYNPEAAKSVFAELKATVPTSVPPDIFLQKYRADILELQRGGHSDDAIIEALEKANVSSKEGLSGLFERLRRHEAETSRQEADRRKPVVKRQTRKGKQEGGGAKKDSVGSDTEPPRSNGSATDEGDSAHE